MNISIKQKSKLRIEFLLKLKNIQHNKEKEISV